MSFAIRVDNLGKRYQLGATHAGSVRELVNRGWNQMLGRTDANAAAAQPLTLDPEAAERVEGKSFWALRDVSFEVQPGEVVGIIGRNGSGKSTLLKILSQITAPTTGRIELHGRVASLLEVGTGFHPELSGRENVFLNGAILGMTKPEIRRKFDEIVAFAEIEKFIDTPVKRYSSGMYVRLAFAVAAHLEPEILIVDEVLAVGDMDFQQKCLGRMGDVAKRGTTVLFVSHNMTAVSSLCTTAVLMEGGKLSTRGSVATVTEKYIERNTGDSDTLSWEGDVGDDSARLLGTRIFGSRPGSLITDGALRIQVAYRVLKPVAGLIVAVEIGSRRGGKLVYSVRDDRDPPPAPVTLPGAYAHELVVPPNMLAEGSYYIKFDLGLHLKHQISFEAGTLTFALQNVSGIGRRFPSGWNNLIRPDWCWQPIDNWQAVANRNGGMKAHQHQ